MWLEQSRLEAIVFRPPGSRAGRALACEVVARRAVLVAVVERPADGRPGGVAGRPRGRAGGRASTRSGRAGAGRLLESTGGGLPVGRRAAGQPTRHATWAGA